MTPPPTHSFPAGIAESRDRRGPMRLSIASTTGFFATRDAVGTEQIHRADTQITHTISAHGHLTFWSCNTASGLAPAGDITSLACSGNHLSSLRVAALSELRYLDCSFNDLETIDLGELRQLNTLIVSENRLFTLPVTFLENLLTLDCHGNQLLSLNLTGLARLRVLDCSENRLSVLKLAGCKSLHTLYAYCNQIARLELTDLPLLRTCDVDHTRPYVISPAVTSGICCNDGTPVRDDADFSAELAQTVEHTRSVAKYVSPQLRSLSPAEQVIRATTYALKIPNADAIAIAAPAMAALIDGKCWLVPVPASKGNVTANLALCRAIAELLPCARVKCAVTRAHPVESSSKRRLKGLLGLLPAQHHIVRVAGLLDPWPVYFVDNVITSGATIAACRRALGRGTGLTYADASSRRSPPLGYQFRNQTTHHENANQNHPNQQPTCP